MDMAPGHISDNYYCVTRRVPTEEDMTVAAAMKKAGRVTRSAQNDEDVGEARGGKLNFKDLEFGRLLSSSCESTGAVGFIRHYCWGHFFIQMAIANMTGPS
ncbi:unnamed protein product [Lepeophtheirus salmonis]|uniref:(salmon louse) hypothetical protein n=1 Tax=Lepeophtheirus salmonis TaxID=72036 RepID=A0A7R8HAL5_LEPSM|nr:unnamed protein product [Lepeophtheirus salmonis]CAF2977342.1 unnamed protein product [Lepeophtheirus salmonis]